MNTLLDHSRWVVASQYNGVLKRTNITFISPSSEQREAGTWILEVGQSPPGEIEKIDNTN